MSGFNKAMSLLFIVLLEMLIPVDTYRPCFCPIPNLDHGYCPDDHARPGLNECKYICYSGYSGEGCEIDIRACSDPKNHCKNGGRCQSASLCHCPRGYTGRYCENDINECGSSPCQHGGTCHDAVGSFTCTCSAGYRGAYCEKDIDECASNPCQHGGTCIDGINKFTCTCSLGNMGTICETEINECASNPCQHGGVCQDGVNKFTCTCTAGYTGARCESDINDCVSNPCHHGGVCHDAVNKFTCICSAGYSGLYCQTDINECSSSPCQHGGVCHDAVNFFTCSCTTGYTGLYCETVNHCSSSPCQNKGACIGEINGYKCNCSNGYAGINCQHEISECHSSPCVNGGMCIDMINGYNCSCPSGNTGRHCQNVPSIKISPKILLNEVKTIDEGSDVFYIPCFAEGIPVPSIKWESIDKPTLPANCRQLAHFLIFKNVTTHDSGLYMCTAWNEKGTDIKVVHVIVKAKPQKLHIAPVIHIISLVQVNYYGDANIICNVSGYPAPSITWKFNRKLLHSSGNSLVVHNVTNTTTGYYTCIATNDAGTSQANVLLKANYDIPRIVTPPTTTVIMTGHSHNFTCIATGHPTPSIKWSFKSFTQQSTTLPSHQLHQHGSLLTLFAIKTNESGTLTCTAQNEFGNDKSSVAVVFRQPSTSGFG